MAKPKPLNTAPGDFGATAEAEAKARAQELLSVELEPAKVAEQHAIAAQADAQRPSGFVATPEAAGPPRRYRVSLEGVQVLSHDDKGRPVRSPHLDVTAASEWGAVQAFAAHNGIPIGRDPLTNAPRLASVHQPKVELLGTAD